ncbi:MAG: hypothetical protein AB2807_09710, partial [Candidatus Sedimenticola endophacoides]
MISICPPIMPSGQASPPDQTSAKGRGPASHAWGVVLALLCLLGLFSQPLQAACRNSADGTQSARYTPSGGNVLFFSDADCEGTNKGSIVWLTESPDDALLPYDGAMSDSGLEADEATGDFLANVALPVPGVGSWNYLVRDADQYCWIVTVTGFEMYVGDMNNAVEATNPAWIDGCANLVAPIITSIARKTPSSSPTGADSIVWTVTFDRAVENVDAADFTVSGTTATVTGVAAVSGAEYDITVSSGDLADLNGTVTLGIAGGQDIANVVHSIPMTDTTPTTTNENAYVLDNVIPTVAIQNAPASHSTNAFPVTIE